MSVSICACGHPWASHLTRQLGVEGARLLVSQGESACKYCRCSGYLEVVTVDDSNRDMFRVRPKAESGNYGTGHPLVVALAKRPEILKWASLSCSACGVVLSTPHLATVFDSKVYCGTCLLTRPEVYLG